MFNILRLKKRPEYVVNVKKRKDGWIEEDWYTSEIALPEWWLEDRHALIQKQTIGGIGFAKYCQVCRVEIPESGCKCVDKIQK